MKKHLIFAIVSCAACMCMAAPVPANPTSGTLKETFKDAFLIGAALNPAQFTEDNPAAAELIKSHFNTISPENILKWEHVHPQSDHYAFELSDRYVNFGEKNGMFVIGHTLVWHNQTPDWVFEDANGKPASREVLLNRMRDHIHTVVGRYKGRIKGWDVVNEALNEDGTLRESRWMRIIGEDYIPEAFRFAQEADPNCELYYNDFSLENEPKRKGAIKLVQKLQAKGVRIDGIGSQHHNRLNWPSMKQVEDTIVSFSKLGVKVMITELDIDVLPQAANSTAAEVSANYAYHARFNPYTNGLPDHLQRQLAARYSDLFRIFVKHQDKLARVTFWGVCDGDSWLNNWPIRGRVSHPLLFDRNHQPKPAFAAVVKIQKPSAQITETMLHSSK